MMTTTTAATSDDELYWHGPSQTMAIDCKYDAAQSWMSASWYSIIILIEPQQHRVRWQRPGCIRKREVMVMGWGWPILLVFSEQSSPATLATIQILDT